MSGDTVSGSVSTTATITYTTLDVNPDIEALTGKQLPKFVEISAEGLAMLKDLLGDEGYEQFLATLPYVPPPTNPDDTQRITNDLENVTQEEVMADISHLMELFAKLGQLMRNVSRTERQESLQAQVGALLAAAAEQLKGADLRRTAAFVQGAFQIAGGLLQVGLAGAAATKLVSGAGKQCDASKATAKGFSFKAANRQQEADLLNADGAKYNSYSQAAGGVNQGLGTSIGGQFSYMAEEHDVDGKKLDTEAKTDEAAYSQANELMQQMLEIIHDVESKLQAFMQAEHETARTIITS